TPTRPLRWVRRARAVRLRRYPRARMASSTRARVSSRTRSGVFRTRETVWCETPAAAATSAMDGGEDAPEGRSLVLGIVVVPSSRSGRECSRPPPPPPIRHSCAHSSFLCPLVTRAPTRHSCARSSLVRPLVIPVQRFGRVSGPRRTVVAVSPAIRTRPTFRCTECGWTTSKWVGRCGECQAWGTVEESAAAAPARPAVAAAPQRPPRRVSDISEAEVGSRPKTGLAERGRVLGGRLGAGHVRLPTGEPGAGKSTLLLTAANSVAAATGRPVLYVSGEEAVHQLATRARRIGATEDHLYLADSGDPGEAVGPLAPRGHSDAPLT